MGDKELNGALRSILIPFSKLLIHLHYKKLNHSLIFSVWGGNDRAPLRKPCYVTDAFHITAQNSLSFSPALHQAAYTLFSLFNASPLSSISAVISLCVRGGGWIDSCFCNAVRWVADLSFPHPLHHQADLWPVKLLRLSYLTQSAEDEDTFANRHAHTRVLNYLPERAVWKIRYMIVLLWFYRKYLRWQN